MTKKGAYLYCVAEGSQELNFGGIGIDDNEVYTIAYKDLLAIAHDCPAIAYDSKDKDMVKKWIIAYQKVIEHVWGKFNTILPLTFDTIIRGEENISPKENTIRWLESDYKKLKEIIDKVRGKAEYGIQIFWNPKIIADNIIQDVSEIKEINDKMKSKSTGTAYLYEEKLRGLIKREMEKRADNYFKEFYGKIRPEVDDIKIDKTKKADNNLQMIINLSCLVIKEKEEVKKLGEILDAIQSKEGFSVKFTGPWPPYSFT